MADCETFFNNCSFILALGLVACDETPTTDQKVQAQQEQLSSQAASQVGVPGITNFTEKKLVRKLYELRDQQIATFSYAVDMNGGLHHVCDSIGYGLPYSVQFTNGEAHYWNNQGNYNLPQAEPNGLFMPPGAEGTWIICAGEKNGDIRPIYVEPRVIVSPFKLHAISEWQVQ